jgi:hypothetical protein
VSRFGITVQNTHKDVNVTLSDQVKVRVLPKPEYDEKGKPKKFKPDPNDPDRRLGGVKGSPSDLKKDEWVVVDLKSDRKGNTYVANIVAVLGEEEKK